MGFKGSLVQIQSPRPDNPGQAAAAAWHKHERTAVRQEGSLSRTAVLLAEGTRTMGETILHWLSGIPSEIQMLILSAFPLTELRGSIPLAYTVMHSQWAWPWWKIYLLAVAGNLLPVPFILWLLGPVSTYLRRWKPMDRFFEKLFARARKGAGSNIEKYEALGLAIFVAIPLPMTGAWSGCVAAFIFGIPSRLSLPAIALGVAAAGAVVMLVMTGALAGIAFLF